MQFTTLLSSGRTIEHRKDMTVACLCTQGMKKPLHDSSPQAWMKRGKVLSAETILHSISLDKIRPETIKVVLKKILVLLQIFCTLAQGPTDAGGKIFLKQGKEHVPDPVAQKPGVIIGGIMAKRDIVPVKIVQ